MVGVPAAVLPAGRGVHVDDGVDTLCGAQVDDAVEVLEALGLKDTWVHVICRDVQNQSTDMFRSHYVPSKCR